ncbi:hypothetical protein MUG12_15510 [Escherichia albertii NBRC 107761 = DSM 17582]|uniref:hypothetical protein n=1 Tax=Escherichia albertii TaxID=208962 RepID=UPI0011E95ECC|nr:hypothetical protein [Escherichia albertii]EFF0834227.1 hypothetical protein [Escherichia albertii]EFF1430329.1 hypothetical protein [Escherichia albertii]EFL5787734.1 hypothetical protein [Escherichia albertii]EFL5797358.1 hypothetical protein [Escherichia albertii]EJC8325946.1 hypothetical protein [Escherichia albertii]
MGAKKNLRIRAGWCKRQGTKSVPNNLTNQYLWDLDCGLREDSSPARKRKGIKGNATRCVNYRLLLQIDDKQKKTCASAQAGVIHVLNPKLTSPINTSGTTTLTIHSQTPLAVNRNSVSQSVTKGL